MQTRQAWHAVADRLRTAAETETARRLGNQGLVTHRPPRVRHQHRRHQDLDRRLPAVSRGVRTSTGTPITLRFPGQWFQAESGLHQNWMRDYDPTTGRYLQADPLGLVDGASVYGYALQSPSKYADPRGECVGLLVYACAAAAGAVVNAAFGILLDFYIGDGCYTWDELARAAAFGAAGGPIGLYGRGAAAGASAAAGYADDGARAAATVVKSGETAATAAGRAAHKAWKPPFGFEKEVRLPSGLGVTKESELGFHSGT